MAFKKLSILERLFLKHTNKPAYRSYKLQLYQYQDGLDFAKRSIPIEHPTVNHLYKAETFFKHSGNIGDIIYSLPTILELSKNGKAHLFLQTDQPGIYEHAFHPLGNKMLNTKTVDMMKPLLLYQSQIATVNEYDGGAVDYDLDIFRSYSFSLNNGNIIHWYYHVFGVYYDTSLPWLKAPIDTQYADKIVIARSHRYRSPLIDYSFLKKYPNKIFLGVEEEYKDMKAMLPDLVFKPVADFLEMATIISSCKLFIGNQSFPFSLAEALKANRLLEVYYRAPNVSPEGPNANMFMYQPQFEAIVKRLCE